MTLRSLIRDLVPPMAMDMFRAWSGGGVRFRGRYPDWQEAVRHAHGYDSDRIVERVRLATRAVLEGKAACERDSVLFDKVPYPFALIATLLRAGVEHGGNLSVLDFGGALGSSYYQCRDFLGQLKSVQWRIVEQAKFVEAGKREFQNEIIRFYESIEACVSDVQPDVIVLSGVLQYLEQPEQILERLCGVGAAYIVIDRTPIASSGEETITVQQVPESISASSYPARFFNEESLKKPLHGRYMELASFPALEGRIGYGRLKADFCGFIFQSVELQQKGAG